MGMLLNGTWLRSRYAASRCAGKMQYALSLSANTVPTNGANFALRWNTTVSGFGVSTDATRS